MGQTNLTARDREGNEEGPREGGLSMLQNFFSLISSYDILKGTKGHLEGGWD